MKRLLLYWGMLASFLTLTSLGIRAQAPNINYSPTTNVLSLGTAFTITPSNSGGTVTVGGYSPAYSFSTIADPYDVTVDAAGNVYTISESNNALYKITPTGTRTTLATGLNEPVGVAVDAIGNIYVSNFGTNQVLKYNTSGTLLSSIGGFNQPYGIAFDASNNAYIVDDGSQTVIKIAAGTTTPITYLTGFTDPYGIAVDPSGNIFVSEYTANDIKKITPGGVRTTFATGLNAPRQLGSDAAGNIYAADYGSNSIKKYTPAGVVSTLVSTGISTPRSVQVDAAGSIYIADYGNNSIRKVAATGWTISAPLPAGLTFNTSTGKISGTPTVTFSATVYTVNAYNASGRDNVNITLSCTQSTINWDGSSSSTWTTAANWTPATVPGPNDLVQIGVSNTNFPNSPIISSNVTLNTLILGKKKTFTLTVAAGNTLAITKNLTVNTGATPTFAATGTAGVNMSPGSTVTVTGTGTLALSSPLVFTLKSDATGDAAIGQLSSATAITGTVTVQRYLSANRSYRLLSSPVYNATASSNNVYSLNYLLNGSFLTGTDGTGGGFDKSGNPTIYLFRESLTNGTNVSFTTGNFRGVKNINQTPGYSYLIDGDAGTFNIPAGNGFLFFFRGSRATVNPYNSTTPALFTTLSTSGALNEGQVTVKDWFTPASAILSVTTASPDPGYTLVGNPYASPIDWDTFQTTTTTTAIYGKNVNTNIYVLDPVTGNYGSYIAGSGGVGSATFVSNIISSGQSFFVIATNATNSKLIFNETAKTATNNTGVTLLMGKPLNYANNQYLRLQMARDSATSDETLVRFNNQGQLAYNANLDAFYKPGFGTASLSTRSSDHIDLSINTVPLPKQQSEHIALNVTAKSDGLYRMTLKDIVAVPELYEVWLMDAYKKDSLDMRRNNTYSFNVYNKDTASFGASRFSLVIRQNPALAYHLLDFTANKLPNAMQVQAVWKTQNEQNYTNFTVERSTNDGKTFDVLGSTLASGEGTYSFTDKSPLIGHNLYRLKQEDVDNEISYSKIVNIFYSGQSGKIAGGSLNIYPNPVINTINLAIASLPTDNASYNIRFMNSSGTVAKEVSSSQAVWHGNVGDLRPGTYLVQVTNTKDKKFVGETKFVKL